MKGFYKGLAAFAIVAAATVSTAQAQANFHVGGGVTIPLGDWADEEIGAAGTGFHGLAGVTFQPQSMPVGVRVDAMFNSNGVDIDDVDASYRIIAGNVNAVYTFQTSETSTFHPYLIGGVGVYNVAITGDDVGDVDSETKFGVNGGAGFNFAAGESLNLFVEGRFHNVFSGLSEDFFGESSSLNAVPITVGVRFGG